MAPERAPAPRRSRSARALRVGQTLAGTNAMLAILALFLCSPRLAAAPGEDPDRLLALVPEGAQVVWSGVALEALRARLEQSAWAQLAADEAMRPFRERVADAWGGAGAEASDAARPASDPLAWWRAASGSFAGFLVLADRDLQALGAFLAPGPDAAAFDAQWAALAEASRAGMDEEVVTVRETPVWIGTARAGPRTLVLLFERDGVHGVLTGREREPLLALARDAIDRLADGGAGGFAGSPALAEARAAAGTPRALEVFLDAGALVRLAEPRRPGQETADQALVRGLLERSGLREARYLYGSLDVGAGERFDAALALHLPPRSLLRDVVRLASPAPRDLLARAPRDCVGALVARFDLAGLWSLCQDTLRDLDAARHEELRAAIESFKDVAPDFESDLLEELQGDVAAFTLRSSEETNLLHADAAYLVRVRDADAVEAFVDGMLGMGGMDARVEGEDRAGHWVQSIGPVSWCFAEPFLVVATTSAAMDAALAPLGGDERPSLTDDERVQRALAETPPGPYLALADVAATFGLLLELADAAPLLLPRRDPQAQALLELLRLLPEPALAAKHFHGLATTSVEIAEEHATVHMRAR